MYFKTKFILYKPLALQEATFSMHYKHTGSPRSYCTLLLKTILIEQVHS